MIDIDFADMSLVEFVSWTLGSGAVVRLIAEAYQAVAALFYAMLKGM